MFIDGIQNYGSSSLASLNFLGNGAVSGFCRLSFFDCKLLSDIFITFCFDQEWGFEELMGDVYIENEISEMPLAVSNFQLYDCALLQIISTFSVCLLYLISIVTFLFLIKIT
ncbi:unnamed protein product [Prunus brigantina]